VLVTGASGLIGRQTLAPLAAAGHDVHAAARRPLTTAPAAWHAADLLDGGARRALIASIRPELLLHLAWFTDAASVYDDPANDRWVEASLDLIGRFRDAGGRRVVVAGSAAEYDWAVAGAGPCREDVTPLAPATRYGRAKDALRGQLAETGGGLAWAWARLFHLYGPGEDARRLVPSIVLALRAGRPALCTAGTQIRDFMDSRDAGAALAALLDAPVAGAVNIGSGTAISVAAVATELGRIAGRSELIRLGALPMRAGEPPLLVPDTRRLAAEVGFRPRHGLADGLEHAWGWWNAEGR
jgi:nucleoside-diphosphate-sugar epimerase